MTFRLSLAKLYPEQSRAYFFFPRRRQKMNDNQITYPRSDRWSYVWLILSMLLGIFSLSIGRWTIPITSWLGPIFAIRFMRTQRRSWLAYLLLVITTAVSVTIALPSFLGELRPSIIIGSAIIANLAFLADRLLVPHLPGFVGTLVFPSVYTAMEFINTLTNPLGSFGGLAYTQFGNLPILQLVSVTGMLGLTFLISWLASFVNWAWEREFAWAQIKRGTELFAGIFLAVLLFGQLRLWFAPPPAETVRIAGFTVVDWRAEQDQMMQALNNDRAAFRQLVAARYPLYFEKTVQEAQAGAKIVVWPEHAAPVAKEDEPALLARAQEIAQQEGIYLAISLMSLPADDSPYEAKMLVYDPNGELVLEHYKYGGVGFEGNRVNGDGILRTAATPYGVISGLICWDTDFPGTVLQAGRNGTDILLSPSLDFQEIDPMHAHMAAMRGIENGVSVVRVSDNGLSMISDPYGRVLASTDHFTSGDRTIIAQVPTESVPTLYPVIGDLIGWLSIGGFIVLVIVAIIRRRNARRQQANAES
jgi:apolipoprotein N-acyltransferase